MRETRLSGSEGGGTELNRSFLPLSRAVFNHHSGHMSQKIKIIIIPSVSGDERHLWASNR